MFHLFAEMEFLKQENNVMREQPIQEPNAALQSAPTLETELFAEKLQASAQRDQNVVEIQLSLVWCATQEHPGESELPAEEEVSSQERPAKLMVLAPNKTSPLLRIPFLFMRS